MQRERRSHQSYCNDEQVRGYALYIFACRSQSRAKKKSTSKIKSRVTIIITDYYLANKR